MDSPQVTVVIPVFNKARYLRECLDSVLQQSLSAVEVICIDDASTDSSLRILQHYARLDPRVTLIRNEANYGAGMARNKGIDAATGRYLQFTDADDLLPPDALDALYRRITSDDVDMVRGMAATFSTPTPMDLTIANPVESRRRFPPLDRPSLWIPWWHQCYMYSRLFLAREQLRYPPLIAGEDPVFVASTLVKVRYISTVARVTYHYRLQHPAEKQRASFKHFSSYLKHAAMVKEIFQNHKPECWTQGYGPFIDQDLRGYLDICGASIDQRRDALLAIEELCA